MYHFATTFVVVLFTIIGLDFRFITVSQAWVYPLPQFICTSFRYDRYRYRYTNTHHALPTTTVVDDGATPSSSSLSPFLYPHVSILLETDRFLVINKPAGIPHHDDAVRESDESTTNQLDAVLLDEEAELDVEETSCPTNLHSPLHQLGIVNLLRRQIALERSHPFDTEKSAQEACLDCNSSSNSNNGTQWPLLPSSPSHLLSNPLPRLYGVHRLDRDTSGILILAKDAGTAGRLARAFRNGLVVKYYTGLSTHKATVQKQGWVQGQMVRGRRKSWYLTRNNNNNNKNNKASNQSRSTIGTATDPSAPYAKTRFFTAGLGHVHTAFATNNTGTASPRSSGPRTLILFRPYTGKTHQLRVAAKSVGLPLWGDPIYSDGDGNNVCDTHTEMKQRTHLHATAIHIPAHALDDQDSTADTISNQKSLDTNATFNSSEGNDLTVWCLPPFASAWPEKTHRRLYNTVLDALVRKHCDCAELIAAFPSIANEECTGEG